MKTTRRTLIARFARARLLAAAILCVGSILGSSSAWAQKPPETAPDTTGSGGGMTLLSSPPEAQVELRGSSEIMGAPPLDLGPQWTGRYKVTVSAPIDSLASSAKGDGWTLELNPGWELRAGPRAGEQTIARKAP